MRYIFVFILGFYSLFCVAQERFSTFNFDIIGLESGYSFNLNDKQNKVPTFTPQIMKLEYSFDNRFPAIGVHGISLYYFDKGSSIGMTGLFFLSYNLLNFYHLENESPGKSSRNGNVNYLLKSNHQLTFRIGGNRWSALSQILTDNNKINISAPTLWLNLEYKYRLNTNFSLSGQVGYVSYWTPQLGEKHDFIDLQFGVNYGFTFIKKKLKETTGIKSENTWKGRFEYQALVQYMYFNPSKLNEFIESYGATPRFGGISGGGLFSYRFSD